MSGREDPKGYALVARIMLQKSKMQVSPKSHLPDAQAFAGADFVHFLGPDTARYHHGAHLPEPPSGPHCGGHALESSPKSETRADASLIYAASLEGVDWAVALLNFPRPPEP